MRGGYRVPEESIFASSPEPSGPPEYMYSRDGEPGAAPLSYSVITFDPEKISRGLGAVVFPPVTAFFTRRPPAARKKATEPGKTGTSSAGKKDASLQTQSRRKGLPAANHPFSILRHCDFHDDRIGDCPTLPKPIREL